MPLLPPSSSLVCSVGDGPLGEGGWVCSPHVHARLNFDDALLDWGLEGERCETSGSDGDSEGERAGFG